MPVKNFDFLDAVDEATPSYIREPKHKREMLALIQKEMDAARQREEIDEFGNFGCSRYGKNTFFPSHYRLRRDPRVFTVDENSLDEEETRYVLEVFFIFSRIL